ncbi:MAG: 1-deoxy-D-xylulose-5-phosphate synthase N-terminal domain-containing protein [Patescibacteria group bacterium]
MNNLQLQKKARWVRLEVLEAIVKSGKSHIGGTYSATDLLVALYYGKLLRPGDRFILSKGHACTALYAIFLDLGKMSRKVYDSYGINGGLGGQLETYIPGVDFNTGSMGHAIGVASGMALASRMDRKKSRAITMIGDAELFEGSCWEAIIFAGQLELANLVVIVDRNRLSVTEAIEDDSIYRNFKKKIESFGWSYVNINGHDFRDIQKAFQTVKHTKQPTMIIADTVKGKGVSFMENNVQWHNALPSPEQIAIARKELSYGHT